MGRGLSEKRRRRGGGDKACPNVCGESGEQAMTAERHKTIEADISQGAQMLESIADLLSQCNAITDECVSNERAGGKAESEAVAQKGG